MLQYLGNNEYNFWSDTSNINIVLSEEDCDQIAEESDLVSKLRGQIEDLKVDIKELEKDLSICQDDLDDSEDNVRTQEDVISKLEKDIDINKEINNELHIKIEALSLKIEEILKL